MAVLAGGEAEERTQDIHLREQEAGADCRILHSLAPERECEEYECDLDVGMVDGTSRMKEVRWRCSRRLRDVAWEEEEVVEFRAGAYNYNERRSNLGSA